MKIVCLSDTHKEYKNVIVPEGDILIHAGDIDIYDYSSELKNFIKWVAKQPCKEKILVAGNHDKYLETYNKEVKQIFKYNNIHYLENSGIVLNNITFWGSPITPTFNSWFFMAERGKQIQKYWNEIPKNTQILITHGPPYGILDQILLVNGDKGNSVGCFDLLQKIKEIKPKYHIFGHIHNGYGIKAVDETTFINCSLMNEEYDLVNNPIVIEV